MCPKPSARTPKPRLQAFLLASDFELSLAEPYEEVPLNLAKPEVLK